MHPPVDRRPRLRTWKGAEAVRRPRAQIKEAGMARILLRAGKSPFQVLGHQEALEYSPWGVFRMNSGNMVFADAVHRILSKPGAEIVVNSFLGERPGVTRRYTDRINAEFDHFAIPLANAFRPSFMDSLARLTHTIKALRIPVSVIGVGIGGGVGSLSRPIDEVSEDMRRGVRAFVDAVLDRSASIGVRGEHTRRFLRALGYGDDVVTVIGCPSLFRNGSALFVERGSALNRESRISMNVSPYVPYMGPLSLYHAARYPRLSYIPQDIATARVMMWGQNPETFDKSMPTHMGHPLFAKDRMFFFVDTRSWTEHLDKVDFSFGTRIHGNIVALVTGTPAVVLVHDTRTRELVDHHEIPYRLVSDLPGQVDAADLYAEADFTRFNAGHRARFDVFRAFLDRNRLATIFDKGEANPAYDAELAALALPGPILAKPQARKPSPARDDRYRFDAPLPHEELSMLGGLRQRLTETKRSIVRKMGLR
jgi:hypothetical protein